MGTTPIGGPLIGWIISESNARVGLGVGAASCFVAAGIGWLTIRHFRSQEAIATSKLAIETIASDPLVVD
jgi:hypothetical protein